MDTGLWFIEFKDSRPVRVYERKTSDPGSKKPFGKRLQPKGGLRLPKTTGFEDPGGAILYFL